MNFFKLLDFNCVQIGSDAKDKDSLLKEIAHLAKNNPNLSNFSEDEIFMSFNAREEISSTSFGNKIAIPHCSFDNLKEFVVGLIVARDGVEFDSFDGQKAEIIFYIIWPKAQRNKHIKILSTISKLMKYEKRTQDIIKKDTIEDLINCLYFIFEKKESDKKNNENCILNIFIQNEEYFNDIIELISSVVEGSISVIETNNAGYYLYKLPLFSGFWSDKHKIFMKVITAIVDKNI